MERSLARQLSNANRVGSSTAKGKQPARDSDSDSFDEEIVVARPRGQIRQSILKPPNNSSESDGGVSISDGGVSISEANLFNFASGKKFKYNRAMSITIVLTSCRRGD